LTVSGLPPHSGRQSLKIASSTIIDFVIPPF
jgi:hypothetical protein